MPLLPASGYPSPDAPSVGPLPEAPGGPFRIPVPDEAFGAATGRALAGVGTAVERSAAVLEERNTLANQIAADDLINQAEEKIIKRHYGDQNVPGDVGFRGLEGKNAREDWPRFRQDVDKIIADHRAMLQNPEQKHRYDISIRAFRNQTVAEAGRHYDRQLEKYNDEQFVAGGKVSSAKIATAAAEGNAANVDRLLQERFAKIDEYTVNRGMPPDAATVYKQNARKDAVKSVVESIALKNPAEADALLERNKDAAGDIYPDLKKALEPQVHKQRVNNAVYGGPVVGTTTATGLIQYTPSTDILTGTGLTADQYQTFRGYLASRESSRYDQPPNAQGYSGRYQMGTAEIQETAERLKVPVPSQQEFLSNPQLQERFFENYTLDHHNKLMTQSDVYRNASPQMKAAYLMGAHIGGVAGVTKYIESGGKINPKDANGTSIGNYVNSMKQTMSGAGLAPAAPTTTTAMPTPGPAKIVAGGDSIGVGLNQNNGLEGTSAGSVTSPEAALADAAGSRNPQQGLDYIKTHPERFAGKNVLWSSGLFNAGGPEKARAALGKVGEQIDALKEAHASNIVLVGLDKGRFASLNPELEKIAAEKGVKFGGPLPTDNIHPSAQGYKEYYASASKLFAAVEAAPSTGSSTPPALTPPPPEPGLRPDNQIPGLQERLRQLDERAARENWAADPKLAAVYHDAYQQIRQQLNGAYADEERAHRLDARAEAEAQSKAYGAVVDKIYPKEGGPPQITATGIANAPGIKKENVSALISLYDRANKPDPPGADSREAMTRLYNRVILPFGDKDKITEHQEIDKEYSDGLMTKEDWQWVRARFDESLTEHGLKFNAAKERYLRGVKPFMTDSNPLTATQDHAGDANYSQFLVEFEEAVAKSLREKLDPYELLDRRSPRYFEVPTRLIKGLPDSIKDVTQGITTPQRPPTEPQGTIEYAPRTGEPAKGAVVVPLKPNPLQRLPNESGADWEKRLFQQQQARP